jgi:Protein of unknown function DUF262
MQYKNSEIKIDQLIAYLNDAKINLSPAFQRGHVWKTVQRRKLVKNIVLARPIPAIFLYKEADGTKYTYNILDGKQRLESLILFIAGGHEKHKIENWKQYFYGPQLRSSASYGIEYKGENITFSKLPDDVIRDFLEYSIPTIEISLTDDTALDEVVNLFVDINQQGEAVKRFDIVKAMYRDDALIKSIFDSLATKQQRGQDVLYKAKASVFTRVLKRLQTVQNAASPNSKVDRMWERLLEIALYTRRRRHRSAVAILKEFIAPKNKAPRETALKQKELAEMRRVFNIADKLSRSVPESRLLTDQTHFYTLITSLIVSPLLDDFSEVELLARLRAFSNFLKGGKLPGYLSAKGAAYRDYSTKQTTDASRRSERGRLFVEIIKDIA